MSSSPVERRPLRATRPSHVASGGWPFLLAGVAVLFWSPAATSQPSRLGGEFRVNTDTGSNETTPSVAMDALGNFVVSWVKFNPGRIDGQRYRSDGSPLGAEFVVKDSFPLTIPALSRDAEGNFVLVWDEGIGAITDVFAQRYDSAGNQLGTEFQVNTVHSAGPQGSPSVAVGGSGEFVVVWDDATQDPDLSAGIVAKRYDTAGVPLGGEFRVNSYTTENQILPRVSMADDGDFVVVWQSGGFAGEGGQDGSGYGIFGQAYDSSGAPQAGEFQINAYTTGAQFRARVSMDSAGNFVVVWCSADRGLVGRRYDSSGASSGSEFQVSASTYCASPAVALHDSGAFVVVWESASGEQLDGSVHGIFGRSFDGVASPRSPQFQVNTYTTYSQTAPALALAPSGEFVVVWTSQRQDGSSGGVFGQRFSLTPGPTPPPIQAGSPGGGSGRSPAVLALALLLLATLRLKISTPWQERGDAQE